MCAPRSPSAPLPDSLRSKRQVKGTSGSVHASRTNRPLNVQMSPSAPLAISRRASAMAGLRR